MRHNPVGSTDAVTNVVAPAPGGVPPSPRQKPPGALTCPQQICLVTDTLAQRIVLMRCVTAPGRRSRYGPMKKLSPVPSP